jgi:nitroreductase
MEFLLTRRSRPAKTLRAPGPGRDEIRTLLTAAARSPDHGKLEPWRFIVLQRGALDRLASLAERRGQALGLDPDQIEKTRRQFADGVVAVAVIEVQKPSQKVPPIEQSYSAGAVCLALLNAALASGWGANWLTSWAAHDREFVREGLGLAENERVAGFIFLGTETVTPPDRPRPDIDAITTWMSD